MFCFNMFEWGLKHISDRDEETQIKQLLVCKPEPGTYYLSMVAGNTTEVTLTYMHLLPAHPVD